MIHAPYRQLVEMKRWADHGLYEVVGRHLGGLSDEGASIMLRILDHMHAVDRIFQCHLQGRPHGFGAARCDTVPEFAALAEGVREVDDWYACYVASLSADDLAQPVEFVFTSGKPACMRRGEIILHVCQHGAYHRGNAGALLHQSGITPSRDSITDFLEDTA